MNHIPGSSAKRFWTSKWFVETVSSVPPVIVAGLAAYRLYADSQTQNLAFVSAGACFWLVGASIVKIASAYSQDRSENAAKDHRDLRAAMHVLHATVSDICKLDLAVRHEKLRATFHRVVPPPDQPEHLEQVINYVGGDAGGAGRTFSIRAGVTGKASRERVPYVYHRMKGDERDCRRELKESWGYTDKDLKTLSLDRFSAIAVPVVGKASQHAVGVIYFDSTEKQLFRDKRRQAAIVAACSGLSHYISERYST